MPSLLMRVAIRPPASVSQNSCGTWMDRRGQDASRKSTDWSTPSPLRKSPFGNVGTTTSKHTRLALASPAAPQMRGRVALFVLGKTHNGLHWRVTRRPAALVPRDVDAGALCGDSGRCEDPVDAFTVMPRRAIVGKRSPHLSQALLGRIPGVEQQAVTGQLVVR